MGITKLYAQIVTNGEAPFTKFVGGMAGLKQKEILVI